MAAPCFCEILPEDFAGLTLIGIWCSQIDLEKEKLKIKLKTEMIVGVIAQFPGWLKVCR